MFAPGTACSGIMTHNKRQIKTVILQIIQNINDKCIYHLYFELSAKLLFLFAFY